MHPLTKAALVAASFAVAAASPAAFAQYDPAASRAENNLNSLNRSMTQQQQGRAIQQQNQFETNALRNELSRPAPPPLVPNVGSAPIRR